VVRYNAEGLAGLHDRPRSGPPGKLDEEQRDSLRAWVLQGPDPEADGMRSYGANGEEMTPSPFDNIRWRSAPCLSHSRTT
jgi:transposase